MLGSLCVFVCVCVFVFVFRSVVAIGADMSVSLLLGVPVVGFQGFGPFTLKGLIF